jgi:hypothetical protein
MNKLDRNEIAKLKAQFKLTDDDVKDFRKRCQDMHAFRICAEAMFVYRQLGDAGKTEMVERLRAIQRGTRH